jgi:valyl-tRNA synthetase
VQNLEAGSKANHDAGILSFDEMTRAVQGQKKMFPSGIPECGTDALRFTLCSHNVKNHFINFDVQECYTNKLFCNKIWQATRFTNSAMDKMAPDSLKPTKFDELAVMDRWILSRLSHLVQVSKESLQMYDFHVTTASIKDFLYFNFCDVYLETTKRAFKLPNTDYAAGHCWTLTTCLDTALRVLAPFMPRLAQHLHKKLQVYPEETRDLGFPQNLNWRDETLEEHVTNVLEVVVAIRRMKKLFGIAAKHQAEVYIAGDTSFYEPFTATIEDLTLSHKVILTSQVDQSAVKDAICDRVSTSTQIFIAVPSELRNAFEVDLSKAESKKTKLVKELEKMNKMISGDNYRVKAKPEAQQMHAKKITMLQEKLARITYMQTMSKK